MTSPSALSAQELRATLQLASVFALRMFGLFIILPVFSLYATHLPGGDNPLLVGMVLGAYGLTQAILQIPFGWLSDRVGRKPVIYAGLVIFALGSVIAAFGTNIYWILLGRIIQGAGAISATVVALVSDVTRESNRTKAMAIIGITIGITFGISIILGPVLNHWIGVPGIFALTGLLALAALGVVGSADARPIETMPQSAEGKSSFRTDFRRVLANPELMKLNFGVFALHAVLTALFVVVPLSLQANGLPGPRHWQVYLPVMVASFALMMPLVSGADRAAAAKRVFLIGISTLVIGEMLIGASQHFFWGLCAGLLVFFVAFNALEATLPALVSKVAPPGIKGTAIGVFSSLQFLGAAVGGAAGGYLLGRFGGGAVFIAGAGLTVVWLWLAVTMRHAVPAQLVSAERSA